MSSSSSSSVINDEMNSGSLHVLIKEADDLNLTQYNINGYSYCKVYVKTKKHLHLHCFSNSNHIIFSCLKKKNAKTRT